MAKYKESETDRADNKDEKYKRSKSHRKSAPNSQRGSKPAGRIHVASNDPLNFNSLLVEESVNTEDPAREDKVAVLERPGK